MKQFAELVPEEVLALAIRIEDSNASRYQEWADRFRPYDPKVSEFLEELVEEEIDHGAQLRRLYRIRFGSSMKTIDPDQVQEHIEDPSELEEHFFVVDNPMAKSILEAALKTELKARHFYEDVLKKTKDAALVNVYKPLAAFEDEHVRVLQKRLKEFEASH